MIGQPIPASVIADPRKLQYVRHVAAGPAQVYAAFTDPEALATWWGPNGFRTETHAMDVRPGGHWRFTMHGPDGKAWPNFIDYDIVEPPSRLHWRHRAGEDAPPDFEVELTLTPDIGGGTRIGFTMILPDQAARDAKAAWGAAEGAQQTLDRLESLLTGDLRLSRRFAAPRALVWRMLSEPAHLEKWWGPAGHSLDVVSLDFRAGGRFHYRMGEGAIARYGLFEYREIVAPERLVFTNSFADESGRPVRAPFSDDWPLRVLNTWTLDEADGITTLRLHGRPLDADAAGLEIFRGMFESMRGGFGATFDQLQAHLEECTREIDR